MRNGAKIRSRSVRQAMLGRLTVSALSLSLSLSDSLLAKPLIWQVPALVPASQSTDDATGDHFVTGRDNNVIGGRPVAAANGSVYFTWVRRVAPDSFEIWFRKRDASGWAPEVRVSDVGEDPYLRASNIAVAPDGVIHIVYNTNPDVLADPPNDESWEVVHRSSATGAAGSWGTRTYVSLPLDTDPNDTSILVDANRPGLTIDPAGYLWVTWSNKYQDGVQVPTDFPNHLGQYSVRLGGETDWSPPRRTTFSSYEPLRMKPVPLQDSCPLNAAVECWFLPSWASGGGFLALGPGDLFYLGGDSPGLEAPAFYQYENCSDMAPSEQRAKSAFCFNFNDFVLGKSGIWDASADSLVWWGHPGFVQGSDVRISPVPDEELNFSQTCPIADTCAVSGVPRSYTPYIGNRKTYNYPHGTAALRLSATDDTVYAMWTETNGTTYGGGIGPEGAKGGDIWVRTLTRNTSGAWTKGTRIEAVSRTPYFPSQNPTREDTNRFPRAAGADVNGWIHVVYERLQKEVGPPVNSEVFWREPDRQIFYATHDVTKDLARWGWEIQISDPYADSTATAYTSIADDGGKLHVVYTQYNSGTDLDVFYREGTPLQPFVATGNTVVWDSVLVFLDQDFTVQQGGTLIIEAGTKVYFQTPEDIEEGPLPKMLVQGRLLVNGTPAAPVVFTSTKDSTAGEWGGIEFELAGANVTGYGYVGCTQPLSSITNAHIENSAYGIRIRNHCAPSLSGVTFAQITNERHIMLDSTDVIIPLVFNPADSSEIVGMGSWSLAKTKVVAANGVRPGQDVNGGETGKADIIVYGGVGTSGSTATGDSVYFRPETITPVASSTAGADWGGMVLASYAEENLIEYADMGYAANPLFMYYPDSGDIVRNSRVHHFADIGIWVQGSMSSAGVIEADSIYRGTDLHPTLGRTGIFLDQANHFTFTGNAVEMTGAVGSPPLIHGGAGVSLYFGSSYCLAPPPPGYRLLLVNENTLVGPGHGVDEANTTFRGVYSNWICGTLNQDVRITENLIKEWNTTGIYLTQNADVDVSCNRIELNRRGVEHFRTSQPAAPPVGLKENRIQVAADASVGVRAWDAQKIKLGPQSGTTGDNQLRTNEDRPFIYENQTGNQVGFHPDLNADQNHWFIDNVEVSQPSQVDVTPYIDSELSFPNNSARVDVDPLLVYPPQPPPPCWPLQGSPPSGALAGLSEGSGPDERGSAPGDAGAGLSGESVPSRTEVGAPFPNPARAGLSIPLAVSPGRAGRFEVFVYDVRGRRTAAVLERAIPAGRHLLEWDGRDTGGNQAAAGIYFLQVKGPEFEHTSKFVLLE